MNIILSNKGETLFQLLKENLFFKGNHPFEKRGIVVEGPLVKEWITERLAEDLGTAIGINFFYPETLFNPLTITKMELSLTIEISLKEIHSIEELTPLLDNPKRLHRTANSLTKLFLSYITSVGEEDALLESPWQKQLFSKIKPFFKKPQIKECDTLHLFSIRHLPKLTFHFLEQLDLPVTLYVLTPCHTFWSDLITEKQRLKLFHKWFEKGLSIDTLEETLQETHPLLANFGSLGKTLAALIEDSQATITEHFLITEAQRTLYEDKLFQDEIIINKEALTLLEALQADLLFLESKENQAVIDDTSSLEVHETISIKREVETLIEALFNAFEKGLTPKDILVLAPNITPYLPYLKHLFKKEGIPYQIVEEESLEKDPHVQALLGLIEFAHQRFEREALFTLLDHPALQKRCQFTEEEVHTIKGWFDKVAIFWGFNEEHKNHILQRNHCTKGSTDASGTWENAFEKLIEKGLFTDELKIDSTSFDLLGRFISFTKTLYEDLKPLSHPLTVVEWQNLLKHLFLNYFYEEENHPFFLTLNKFSLNLSDKFPINTLLSHLKNLLQESKNTSLTQMGGVLFASLLSKGIVQKKMIALLGMNEGVFPRVHKREPFDLKEKKLLPTVTEIDRMLFLEAITLAEEKLYISYPLQNDETLPSLLVTELLSYIKKRFNKEILTIEKEKPYDPAYFQEGMLTHIKGHFEEAEAYLKANKTTPHSFLDFSSRTPSEEKETQITIQELKQIGKNPLKRYFQKGLRMYLKEEEIAPLPSDEPFVTDSFTLFNLKQEAFTGSLEEALSRAKEENKLPFGPFYKATETHITTQHLKNLKALETLGVSKDELITFILKEETTEPLHQEKTLFLPPLTLHLPNTQVTIVGELQYVTNQGLLLPIDHDPIDLIKGWVEALIYVRVLEKWALNYPKKLLCLKSQKRIEISSSSKLETLIEEYLLSGLRPSLLIPEFIPSFVKLEEDKIGEAIVSKMNNTFNPLFNPQLQYGINQLTLKQDKALLKELQTRAKELYKEVFDEGI